MVLRSLTPKEPPRVADADAHDWAGIQRRLEERCSLPRFNDMSVIKVDRLALKS